MAPGPGRTRRAPLGLPLLLAALASLVPASYLAVTRLLDEPAVCGPGRGCETVAASEYSTLFGVLPVAYLGVGFSLVVAGLTLAWWRRADRRALLAGYGLLLLGTLFMAYLTYLEVVVIEAICPWCVAYALAVVTALVMAGLAMGRSSGMDGAAEVQGAAEAQGSAGA